MRHNNSKIKTKTNTIEDKKSHFINVKSQSERKKESKALEYWHYLWRRCETGEMYCRERGSRAKRIRVKLQKWIWYIQLLRAIWRRQWSTNWVRSFSSQNRHFSCSVCHKGQLSSIQKVMVILNVIISKIIWIYNITICTREKKSEHMQDLQFLFLVQLEMKVNHG